jgi:hypothetical protein
MRRSSVFIALTAALCWINALGFAQPFPRARTQNNSLPAAESQDTPVGTNAADEPQPATDRGRPAATVPLTMPSQESIEKARREVEEAYGDICRNNDDSCIDLLLKAAEDTALPARKYAALAKAEALAVEQGLVARALTVVRLRCKAFGMDETTSRLETLTEIFKRARKQKHTSLLHAVFEEAESLFEDFATFRSDDQKHVQPGYDLASSVAKDLAKAFKANGVLDAHNLFWIEVKKTALDSRYKNAAERAREHARYRFSLSELAEGQDAAAAAVVGRYLCIYEHDWKKGLDALAKSDHKEAKALAVDELAAQNATPRDPAAILAIARRWWDAETVLGESDEAKTAARRHAAELYASVSESLTDPLDKQAARNRAALSGTDFKTESLRRALMKHMPEVAFQDDGHTYLVILTPMPRLNAAQWCKGLGGYLIRVNKPVEHASLATALDRISKNLAGGYRRANNLQFWIDGTRRGDGKYVFDNGDVVPEESLAGVYRYSRGPLCIAVDAYNPTRTTIRSSDGDAQLQLPFVCEWDWQLKPR